MAGELHVKGTVVEWDSAGGTSYATLGRVAAVMPPPMTRGSAEVTNFASTNAFREYIQGWLDSGEPTMRFRFHKTQFALLQTSFKSSASTPKWRISLPTLSGETTPTRCVFDAFLSALGVPEKGVDGEDIWEAEVTLRTTGEATWTAGS